MFVEFYDHHSNHGDGGRQCSQSVYENPASSFVCAVVVVGFTFPGSSLATKATDIKLVRDSPLNYKSLKLPNSSCAPADTCAIL